MNENLSPARIKAPDHVPQALVYDFAFESVSGVEKDVVPAVVDAMRALPDIFYAVNVRRVGSDDGHWIVTRHELMREIFQDPATFSSYKFTNLSALVGEDWLLLPIEEDPPAHGSWRMLLNPIFSPSKMKTLEERIDELAIDLVEGLKPRGGCEFMKDFAQIFPVQIFLRLFGLPLQETATFVEWARLMMHSTKIEDQQKGAGAIVGYLRQTIQARRQAPTEDLISYVVTSEVQGRRPTADEAIGFCFLLYAAGLDTVAAAMSFMFRHLAEHPADQQRLRDNPDLIPDAVEEYLRAYPPAITGRLVTRDIEFHGVTMKRGDWIKLPIQGAGRDEREFPNPNVVDFGRDNVTHITFGAGPHRCVGSHLARRELRIALGQWLKRIPPFSIAPGEAPVTDAKGVLGTVSLPLSW